jgi:serine/threonine protein kinase
MGGFLSEVPPGYLAGFGPGSLIAGYRVETMVGTGGMAAVFRARDVRLDRLVALKILDPGRASDPEFRQRFFAESRAAAKVDDPHIIPVYEADEAGEVLYIAMRYVPGGDLRRLLEREGALPPARAAEFISPVASALDAAHGAGLVHRDVKPANILVDTRQGRPDHVYLSDFGIAKTTVSTVNLTGPFFIGTADYAPPEQIDGKAIDGRADQYALACVAYRLLTGAVPYEREQELAVMVAHLYASPPSLAARRPELPGAADKVLAKAMSKSADQRYGSCGEFADALREALGVPPYRPGEPAAVADFPPPPAREPHPHSPADEPHRIATLTIPLAVDVPRATPRSARNRRGRRAWRVAGVSACVAVVAIVAAGAVLLTTRQPSELADSGNQSNLALPAYPGQRGAVTVGSIASAGDVQEAVGSADGHPAVWRRFAGGAWTLVSGAPSAVYRLPAGAILTGVAHGPAGWIAVGHVGVPSPVSGPPVIVTSADGVAWRRAGGLAAPGSYATAVTAGPGGYVVVGQQASMGRTFAAMWWSADLRNWVLAGNGGLTGRQRASTVNAVAASPAGFVAAGAHGTGGGIWTSAAGQGWHVHDMAMPPGATSATLRMVAVNGSRVAAAGYAVTGGGDIPFAVVSADGGRHWSGVPLTAPHGLGAVTALTAAGSGFIAAGRAGPAHAQHAVTWSSPDGLRWSAAAPTDGWVGRITALSASEGTVTGAAEQGTAAYIVSFPAP